MTLNKLHQMLGKLIAQGHGRRRVSIDKSSFRDNRENEGLSINSKLMPPTQRSEQEGKRKSCVP